MQTPKNVIFINTVCAELKTNVIKLAHEMLHLQQKIKAVQVCFVSKSTDDMPGNLFS